MIIPPHILHFILFLYFIPPVDHEWSSEWRIWIDNSESKMTDREGWSYAVNFDGLTRGKFI